MCERFILKVYNMRNNDIRKKERKKERKEGRKVKGTRIIVS